MKKYLIPALALGLVMTSCQSDEPFAPVEGGEKQVTFTLNVPGELGTRADFGQNKSDKGGATNQGAGQIKYTLVLKANDDTQILKHDQATVNGTTATFKPTVVLGREYTITAYASLNGAWGGEQPIAITNSFNDESKDAYFKTLKHNFANGDLQPLTLTRPYGKLRLIAEDYDPAKTKVETVTITYENPQHGTFDATTETFTIASENVTGTTKEFGYYEAADATGAHTIFAEYLPTPKDKESEYPVKFTVTVKYKNDPSAQVETYSRTFNDIPVKRNALTTLKGNFFTAGAEITVEVDDDFENFIPGEGNDKAEEQLRMAAIMGGSYTLPCDITLSKPLKVEADMTLNLGGHTITTTEKETGRHHYAIDNYATLVIEGEGAINARGIQNFGQMTINGDITITNVDTNGGAAIWNEGKLTINDGTFKTNKDAGNAPKGGALQTCLRGEAVVNGGTFEAYSQYTYAIINEGKTVINNATVKGKHGAIAGAESNDQTTINGGSFKLIGVSGQSDHCAYCVSNIRGGVFSINEADASAGDSVFYSSQIADGYKAVQVGDKYMVVSNETTVCSSAINEDDFVTIYNGEFFQTPINDALYFNNCYLLGDATIQVNRTYGAIILENVVGDLNGNVIEVDNDNNSVMVLQNCDFTLKEGKKLITSTKTIYQVFMSNITINGVKLTQENAGQYLENVGWYQVVEEI